MSKIKYPAVKCKMWGRYLRNKIFGAISSLFILIILQFLMILLHSDIEKVSIYPLIKGIINGSVVFLMAGFGMAIARSLYKGCRDIKSGRKTQEQVIKDPADMKWTYCVNYPLILSLIYILGTHFLREAPLYVYRTILFGLGFYVDVVFEEIVSIIT